jgi:hypothetical protein
MWSGELQALGVAPSAVTPVMRSALRVTGDPNAETVPLPTTRAHRNWRNELFQPLGVLAAATTINKASAMTSGDDGTTLNQHKLHTMAATGWQELQSLQILLLVWMRCEGV